MATFYKTYNDLKVHTVDGSYIIPANSNVLTEADGTLSSCDDASLDSELARIEVDITARDLAIAEEAARLVALEPEEPIEGEGEE